MKVIGVIPSRLSSSRLSKKPLAEISGIPMIAHVIERSKLCKGLDDLYIATDSIEICEVAKQHNCKYFLTSKDHATGTDRIGEIISLIDADIIVNIQGDEALVRPSDIEASFKLLIDRSPIKFSMLEPLNFTFAEPLIEESYSSLILFKSAFSKSRSKSKSTKSSEKSTNPLKSKEIFLSSILRFPSKI